MGAIKNNKPVTLGNKYKQVTAWNIRNIGESKAAKNIRFSKEGKNSILNEKSLKNINKDDLQALYKYMDENKDGNITYHELYTRIYEILDYADNNSHVSDDDIKEVLDSYGIKLKDTASLAEFIKAAENLPDSSKNITSGSFNLDGKQINLEAKPDDRDPSGRTYTLTDTKGNKNYTATFGGQYAQTRQMVSEFYAKAFNNPDLKLQLISQQASVGGEIQGTINSNVDIKSLDKSTKTGLDAFFSNDENSGILNYSGTLAETSHDINTSFSFIPNEFDAVLSKPENQNMTKKDLAKALDSVSSFSEEDIHGILNKYGQDKQYETILTKRKAFFAEMKTELDKTPQKKGESIKDYAQRIRLATMENLLDKTTDISDIKAFTDSLGFINDPKIKQDIQTKIKIKRSELSAGTQVQARSEITQEKAIQMLENFGFTKQKDGSYEPDPQLMEDIKKRYPQYTNIKQLKSTTPDELITMLKPLKDERNIPKTKEDFEDFWVIKSVMGKTPFDKPAYDLVLRTIQRNIPNDLEQEALYKYKSDNNYTGFHSATDAKFQRDVEPTPEMKERMEHLDRYLHKKPTIEDVTVYRGEHADVFSHVQMPDGTNLGDKLMELKNKIPTDKKTPIPQDVMNEINQVVDFINKNGCNAANTRFCSTSLDSDTANNFNDFGLKLNIPAGSPVACIDARNIKQISKDECEVLSPPGSQEIINGAYFDSDARRIILTGTLIAQ